MKVLLYLILLGSLLASSGCGKKNNVKSGVAKLKAVFPTAAQAGSAPVDNPAPDAGKPVDVNATVARAILAIESSDYVNAVSLLATVRKQRNLTADQHMALQETIANINKYLVNRASQGDAKAKAALAELEGKPAQ